MMRLNLICLLVLIVSSFPCFAQKSTPEDFQDFTEAFVGRWVSEFTFATDWPGIGKKGETTTAYFDAVPMTDGKVLLASLYFGASGGNWMAFYNPESKEIRWVQVSSAGTVFDCVVLKNGADWVRKCTGGNPDGSKIKTDNSITVSDNGDTHTWRGQISIAGKTEVAGKNVWKRVSKK